MFFLSPSYPDVHPEVYVSSNDLSRVLQDDLNTSLHEHITTYITTGKILVSCPDRLSLPVCHSAQCGFVTLQNTLYKLFALFCHRRRMSAEYCGMDPGQCWRVLPHSQYPRYWNRISRTHIYTFLPEMALHAPYF